MTFSPAFSPRAVFSSGSGVKEDRIESSLGRGGGSRLLVVKATEDSPIDVEESLRWIGKEALRRVRIAVEGRSS